MKEKLLFTLSIIILYSCSDYPQLKRYNRKIKSLDKYIEKENNKKLKKTQKTLKTPLR